MKNIRLNKNEYRLHKMAASAAFLLKLTLQNVIRELTCEHEQRTTVLKFDKEELICLI